MIILSKRAKGHGESQSQLRGAFTNLSSQDNRVKEVGFFGRLGDGMAN